MKAEKHGVRCSCAYLRTSFPSKHCPPREIERNNPFPVASFVPINLLKATALPPMSSEPIQNILEWIEIYRAVVYAVLFGYCALKSGALPLFAGLVASTGALDVALVAIATFSGGHLGDELRFLSRVDTATICGNRGPASRARSRGRLRYWNATALDTYFYTGTQRGCGRLEHCL